MDNTTEKPGYWAVLPPEVRYSPDLASTSKLIFAEISALTNLYGYCFASNAYLTELFQIGERTLQGHLKALENAGYIRIVNGEGGQGRRKIFVNFNLPAQNPAENCGVPRKNLRGDPAENCGENKKKNNKSNNPPQKPPKGGSGERRKKKAKPACEYEPEIFERLWNAYPRHEGKGYARYAWDELRPNRKLMMEMSDALKRQKETDEWCRGVGICWLVRWLNERRWEWDIGVTPAEDEHEEEVEYL